ncbi:MAG: FAD-dependent oxidoreductase [Planctomycetes bacterium]|nr:FAD-dependent oxidoreductase [Planctomycetota bacterium]
MRLAIVGSGISGLVCAWLMSRDNDVVVFEADDRVGGHTHTVDLKSTSGSLAVDTGFIVFNRETYPNFCRILDALGVEDQPTSMSFSVQDLQSGLVYNGTSLNRLFVQRRNLLRPSFHRMVRDILRFNRSSDALLAAAGEELTIREYLREAGLSAEFERHYLVPLGASLWSCPPETFYAFPLRFLLRFLKNHGMTTVNDRPEWRVIKGGSREYVRRLIEPFEHSIRTCSPITSARRSGNGVALQVAGGDLETFDHVIFACHADQALKTLADPSPLEAEILGSFPYQKNDVVLHDDASLLPRAKRAWASWNYRIGAEPVDRATVTYNMNILQGLESRRVHCVTLNETGSIDPDRIIKQLEYEHPIYTARGFAAQPQHHALIDVNRTSFCGAYWGNGFHEDGVNSALAVCRALGRTLES